MTLVDVVKGAEQSAELRNFAGIDQQGLDDAARAAFSDGAFEESAEECGVVLAEFFTHQEGQNLSATESLKVALSVMLALKQAGS